MENVTHHPAGLYAVDKLRCTLSCWRLGTRLTCN